MAIASCLFSCGTLSLTLPPLLLPQDSTLIMQLLRDNLTLWTSDMQVSVSV